MHTSDQLAVTSWQAPVSGVHAAHPRAHLVSGLLVAHKGPIMWSSTPCIMHYNALLLMLYNPNPCSLPCRNGTELQPLLQRPGGLLAAHRDQIIVIEDPVPNALSSTRVREQLAQGRTVKYLLPDAVLDYIQRYGLYRSDGRAAQ